MASTEHYDLAIIGSGSGNSLVTSHFRDKRVAVIEEGVFGGTCLNRGCIPTKMYVYAADVATSIREAGRLGIDATLDRVRWTDIRDRIFARIDPISAGGLQYRFREPNTTPLLGHARFTGQRTLEISTGDTVTADQIVIAAGAHPVIPDVITDSGVAFHTSDTVMRIDALPRHLLILGGGYVAMEFAHIFSAFGCEVTVIARGSQLLRHLDSDIADAFTRQACEQWDVRLGVTVTAASSDDNLGRPSGTTLTLSDGSEVSGDLLLVATGRHPSTEGLDLDAAGIGVHPDGRVVVDEYGRTAADGVWALGDVSSPYQLKHVANHEARVVAHNLANHRRLQAFNHRAVPAAVFSHPQVASVGLTEEQARAQGLNYSTALQNYGDTAYGWAMEDKSGLCKLIADPATGRLIGAHLLGYQASNLIQPLIQAISFDQPVGEVARGQYWIHPALMEVVENALLKLHLR